MPFFAFINPILDPALGQLGVDKIGPTVSNFLQAILSIALTLGAVIFFFMLIWGGYEFLTSAGDKEKMGMASKRLTSALIGIIILLCILVITRLASQFFGVNLLAFQLPTFSEGPGAFIPLPTFPGGSTPTPTIDILNPTPTPTPGAPTPTPSFISIVPINASGNCQTACTSRGYTCVSRGTDAAGENGARRAFVGGTCADQLAFGGTNVCTLNLNSDGGICEGRPTQWTNCKCGGSGPSPTPTLAPLIAPTMVSCSTNLTDRISVTFRDNSTDEDGFRIYRNDLAFRLFDNPNPLIGTGQTFTYPDFTAICGTSYTYTATAYRQALESPVSSTSCTGIRPCSVPTSTPTPVPVVVLNEPAPGISQSCNTVCGNSGRTCIDIGTNATGTGGTYNTLSGFSCSYSQPASCNTTLTRQPQIAGGYVVCTGHFVDWTYCRCQ
ncbi:MAG TPA: pilin [Patescibacteria group bacterium]|nr:pilin [Patescibacteria group bacterium]